MDILNTLVMNLYLFSTMMSAGWK